MKSKAFLKRKLNYLIIMEKKNVAEKIGRREWILIWVVGLAGQLCWNVENQWFNTFIYAKIGPYAWIISWMTAVSSIVTTFSTFFWGTWSDRKGKRRPFIFIGYLLWGLFTILFGVSEFLPKNELIAAAVMIVAMDALMSFFGSMGNDAAFSSWTTDISNEHNRGQIGAALAALPIIATIAGTVISGILIDLLDYFAFFIIMGVSVIIIGVFGGILIKEGEGLEPNKDEKGFWHQFFSVFNFKTVKENKELFCVFLTSCVYFICFNFYYAHIGNLRAYVFLDVLDRTLTFLGYNKKQMDIPPTVINDRTLVPVRAVAELLGAEVEWLGETKTVDIKYDLGTLENNVGYAEKTKTCEEFLFVDYDIFASYIDGTIQTITGKFVLQNDKEIKFELYPQLAPETVAKFVGLARAGGYENTIFHRVIDGFMAQGGGFYADNAGYLQTENIMGEFLANSFPNVIAHKRGVMSYARANDYNSGSSQFFIVQTDSPHLDGYYAAFGKVTEGIEVVGNSIFNLEQTSSAVISTVSIYSLDLYIIFKLYLFFIFY